MDYGYIRQVDTGIEEAAAKLTEELSKDGFGVLCTIDVQATLKKKLDKDVRPYIILGACNPPLADQALAQEKAVGLLMPCNVVVYEDEDGSTKLGAVDVTKLLGIVGRPELADIAADVTARLRAAVDRV